MISDRTQTWIVNQWCTWASKRERGKGEKWEENMIKRRYSKERSGEELRGLLNMNNAVQASHNLWISLSNEEKKEETNLTQMILLKKCKWYERKSQNKNKSFSRRAAFKACSVCECTIAADLYVRSISADFAKMKKIIKTQRAEKRNDRAHLGFHVWSLRRTSWITFGREEEIKKALKSLLISNLYTSWKSKLLFRLLLVVAGLYALNLSRSLPLNIQL